MPDLSPPSVISDSGSDISDISPYEAAAIWRREENCQLLVSLGLLQVNHVCSKILQLLLCLHGYTGTSHTQAKKTSFEQKSIQC